VLVALAAGCAARAVPPPLPAALRYPDFVFPAVPAALRQAPGAERIDAGWRYLQNDLLRNAEREFAAAIRRSPSLYPARAGEGYVALARDDHDTALDAFDAALRDAPGYAPALVGRGQALLELERGAEALAAFERALAADPSLTALRQRIDVLRFRSLQDLIAAARSAAAAGRLDDARDAYDRALAASPESAFLHRELGAVERRRGSADAALAHFRRAVELDPLDAASLADIGALLEERGDFEGAAAAYRRAAMIEPNAELTQRIAAAASRAREARLPAEYHVIPESQALTRGELAALIGIRFDDLLRRAPSREVVITDTRDHWAGRWIAEVARAAVMDPFENHTFQPAARINRGELAAAVSRILTLLAANDAALRKRIAERPRIADMAASHLSYPAAAAAVAAGVMPLYEGARFQVARAVSGQEAIDALERLRALPQSGGASAP
jgi:tetratricopeptide (TPR) repeat protein